MAGRTSQIPAADCEGAGASASGAAGNPPCPAVLEQCDPTARQPRQPLGHAHICSRLAVDDHLGGCRCAGAGLCICRRSTGYPARMVRERTHPRGAARSGHQDRSPAPPSRRGCTLWRSGSVWRRNPGFPAATEPGRRFRPRSAARPRPRHRPTS